MKTGIEACMKAKNEARIEAKMAAGLEARFQVRIASLTLPDTQAPGYAGKRPAR